MKAPEDDPIGVSTQLLASLYSEIASVQTFKARWTLVKSKLDDIRSQLAEFADSANSAPLLNPLSSDLVAAVAEALSDAVSLARKCQNPSLADGKLRTQSEIDSVTARLDRAARDGEILIRSGILNDGASSSSSSAATGASRREAARSESRSLVTRLQIGAPESRSSAMDALLRLLGEDDKSVVIAVAQGVVPAVVGTLDSPGSSPEMKEKAVAAIARVCVVESGKNVLIAEGLPLLNHLLRVLDSGSGFCKEKACVALQALTFSRENARAIGSRGGISSLLEICRSGTPGSQASAAGVLRNLAAFAETRENFVEENGIAVLLALASSGTTLAQENSIGALCGLIADDESLKLELVRENGIECLKNFWDSATSPRSLEVAAELLRHLALLCSPEAFAPRLAAVLGCGALGARVSAAQAVRELAACGGSRAGKEIGESGCLGALIGMLDGKAAEEKEAAARALSALMQFPGNRKVLRRDEKGVASLVRLLDPSAAPSSDDKKYPVAVLLSLSHSKRCRKEMIAAGAAAFLQRLAEADVEGSKKLLESLDRGKMWGVFGRS